MIAFSPHAEPSALLGSSFLVLLPFNEDLSPPERRAMTLRVERQRAVDPQVHLGGTAGSVHSPQAPFTSGLHAFGVLWATLVMCDPRVGVGRGGLRDAELRNVETENANVVL